MSGSLELDIPTGADWFAQLEWLDAAGAPYPFDTPTLDIRQDYSPQGVIIAKFDESGDLDGTLTITQPGVVQISLDSEFSSTMQPGRGFWDLFVNLYGTKVRLAFGTVSITPHVTVS